MEIDKAIITRLAQAVEALNRAIEREMTPAERERRWQDAYDRLQEPEIDSRHFFDSEV